ncbi:MAG: leucyl/phenylalanyl-tRNA--protein transferase [Bacteroidales bacterium]|jgi:leucyl/phenylalanyl-tRNA--protein transferase
MVILIDHSDIPFPSVEEANEDGLLAVGGDLSVKRLVEAYSKGIFPWFTNDEYILWWSLPERMVLFLDDFKVSKSLRLLIKKNIFKVTFDTAFQQVIANCANVKRKHESGTWITPKLQEAYVNLHEKGYAHSVEVWHNDELVGGLYGVAVGKAFCGESMFHTMSNTSKIALYNLVELLKEKQFHFIDAQTYTDHMASLGAKMITRKEYIFLLEKAVAADQ